MASEDQLSSPNALLDARAKRRFRVDGYSETTIMDRGRQLASLLLQKLPSNYSKILETNQGLLYRAVAEEMQRFEDSLTGVSMDASFEAVRPEMLYQNFAAYLFLGNKAAISPTISEADYRDFLQKVKRAYLRGSKKESIEESLEDILGLTVVLRELYREARKPNSPYSVKDTHRMLCDILMDDTWDRPVGDLLQEISYYTGLIRPAHTLLETRLVWTDRLGAAGGCYPGDLLAPDANGTVPQYGYTGSYGYTGAYAPPRSYLLRLMAYGGDDSAMVEGFVPGSGPAWITGEIASIDGVELTIELTSGTTLYTGSDSLFYSHDTEDYRILFSDLLPGDIVQYQAITIPGSFQFYREPPALLADPELAYDSSFNQRPVFQEYVVKEMDDQGRFPLIEEKCHGALADRWVTDVLEPMYEDLRDNCDYPAPRRYSSYVAGDTGYSPSANQPLATFVSPGVYTLSPRPVLSEDGELATASDLSVWVNGVKGSSGLVSSLDPITGELVFSTPPAETDVIRLDYWYSTRYPTEELFSYVAPTTGTHPVINGETGIWNVGGAVTVVEEGGVVKHLTWPYAVEDELYGDDRDIQMDKFPVLNALGELATVDELEVYVNGVGTTGAVESLQPLLGHVRLTFVPPPGSTLDIRYFYTEKHRSYALVPDDPSYTYDAEYGNFFNYSLVPDYPNDFDVSKPIQTGMTAKLLGYRYRAYQLASTSVLNSSDTLVLSNYSNPNGDRASFNNSYGRLGQAELVFSPEHLEDKSRYITLDDSYLQNGLDPVLKLQPGTPTFQQTFTDAGATGLIRHMPLSAIRDNHQILMYSDLRQEVTEEGDDVAISSICDSRGMDLEVMMTEEYFPNREMRLNDYLDYVERQEVLQIDNGYLAVIKGSDIIKSVGSNWAMVPRGGIFDVGGHKYTVVEVLNADTIRVHERVSLASGEYQYDLTMEQVQQVKVNLNDLTRSVKVNISSFLPGYTPSGSDWVIPLQFPDPDPDPYPYTAPTGVGDTGLSVVETMDYHGYTGAYGNTGLPLTEEAAVKMVKWRNWDQDIVICSSLGPTGVNPEDYPDARIRPGGTGAPWSVVSWDLYLLGYRGDSPYSTGTTPGVTGSVPYRTLTELVGTTPTLTMDGSWLLDGSETLDGGV